MAPLVRRVVFTIISALCGLFLYLHFSEQTLLQTSIFREQLSSPSEAPEENVYIKEPPQFSWRDVPEQYPVDPLSMLTLPRGPDADIPQIQFDFRPNAESATHRKERQRRLSAVKEAFQHSWNGYRKNAWLHDEVKPLSGLPSDPFGGWAATLVDTLDTLWIIGLQTEFEEAVDALHKIDFSKAVVKEINVFETTIRYLGGFLSAYDLSGGEYPLLLQKAEEVAELLYKAFDTPNRMPITRWDWKKYVLPSLPTSLSYNIIDSYLQIPPKDPPSRAQKRSRGGNRLPHHGIHPPVPTHRQSQILRRRPTHRQRLRSRAIQDPNSRPLALDRQRLDSQHARRYALHHRRHGRFRVRVSGETASPPFRPRTRIRNHARRHD